MDSSAKAIVWLIVGIPLFPVAWGYKRAENELEDDDNH